MNANYIPFIAADLKISARQVTDTAALLEQGATIPFISRYRKEVTGNLDEVAIAAIQDEIKHYTQLEQRRQAIISAIDSQGKLTPELQKALEESWDLNELEDLYLPFKQKRKTRADIAREKGLEPLAGRLMKQEDRDVESLASRFLNVEVETVEEALSGARDIMAEWMNERASLRSSLRNIFQRQAQISSTVKKSKEQEASTYRDYFDFTESIRRCPSHRVLALFRGESEGFLKVQIRIDDEEALALLDRFFVKGNTSASAQVALAAKDAWKRLLLPALETEFKGLIKEKADKEAVRVFAENLRQLLMAPPLGPRRLLAVDPGFSSGCKLVCLDEKGSLLHNENIYPHPPRSDQKRAASVIRNLIEAYKLEAIAIGNGTAGRETQDFIQSRMPYLKGVEVFMVNEAGASVYSASSIARKEFPTYDVTVRGAVSIGRRLIDPLAELVKIDPKSIGVGQYQHDVDQNLLKESLEREVSSVVNNVGVNINTASPSLLSYVSGIGPVLAENIVTFREENGLFNSRKELLKVKGMGPKSFEQSAGFLRIPGAENPLDNSAVHPESYGIAEKMAKKLQTSVQSLIGKKKALEDLNPPDFITEKFGLPTILDIIRELEKPARDPRGKAEVFLFDSNIRTVKDLKVGMILDGLVSNITNFGAFVDIGVKQDGLVHISQLADRFVKDPNEVVRLQQQVKVKVLEVDEARKRIQLSMKL